VDEIDELPERDELPAADEDSPEYKAGFLAGEDGQPCNGTTLEWQRGWADAQE
jgi:hypothetical protein